MVVEFHHTISSVAEPCHFDTVTVLVQVPISYFLHTVPAPVPALVLYIILRKFLK
jgi:hypothetical protein